MNLSVIIPVFNEEKTIVEILKRVLDVKIEGVNKEIIVVDDGSNDKTFSLLSKVARQFKEVKVISKENGGKGSAVARGISEAKGDYIIIQDADLEYNPEDIRQLMVPIKKGRAQVVYGTRLKRFPNFFKDERNPLFLLHYFGNRFLSLLTSIIYGQWITDMETCYKLFPKNVLLKIELHSKRFDFEPEITAKLIKKGYSILEVPITTTPRGYGEGKKLNTFRDGFIALWSLLRYRFAD